MLARDKGLFTMRGGHGDHDGRFTDWDWSKPMVTKDLEADVRSTGCVPATIGIVAGRVKIGLGDSDLERLADVSRTPHSVKISRRDIAAAIAMKADGGTTICATTIFAAMAGIKVFATGGLGGVHRGGETSMDVSADLQELARCPVGVVSAGIKSILDIGKTLEYLETLGVPVIAYSKTKDFPAFFSPKSGFQTSWNVNDPATAAQILCGLGTSLALPLNNVFFFLDSQFQLGMDNGALIAVPIPEEHSAKGEAIQQAVTQAVLESENNGMSKRGKDVTPWLLSRVAELTNSNSIESNIALLRNTALIGGQIAVEYQNLVNPSSSAKVYTTGGGLEQKAVPTPPTRAKVLVVGSAALDISAQATTDTTPLSTVPGAVSLQPGGVAQNIAQACHRLGQPPLLISPIGQDPWGRLLHDEIAAIGMRTDGLIVNNNLRTAVCNLFLDGTGNLVGGVADMAITENTDLLESVVSHLDKNSPAVVALDGNLSAHSIKNIVSMCLERKIQTLFEPTSVMKSSRILPAIQHSLERSSEPPVTFFTPNILELKEVHRQATESGLTSSPAWWSTVDRLSLGGSFRMDVGQLARGHALAFLKEQGVIQMATALTPFFRHMFIKCGEKGLLAVIRLSGEDAYSSEWAHERSNPGKRYVVAHKRQRGQLYWCR
ncbi:indigoidine synthase A-like protein [Roridomyces roridus]|uniref:Indigoidine synthase A-like protein n=1 Tax=Roridomyces roridus TaxID=1738132 RepID=A0AAD7BUC9_9AGAR|nr:indigoidine synthase A-like protein [Roridomyces roridus]